MLVDPILEVGSGRRGLIDEAGGVCRLRSDGEEEAETGILSGRIFVPMVISHWRAAINAKSGWGW